METGIDLARFRHPLERRIWWAAVVFNLLLCLGAVGVVIREGAWLFATFPFFSRFEGEIRAIALAAVFAPPLLVFTRNRRLAQVRGNGVKVSPSQYPPLSARFAEHCAKLGTVDPPTLYVMDHAIEDVTHAFTSWHREFVVIGTDYLEKDLEALEDVWSFLLGRELGRLAFGYEKWWDQVLLSYVNRLPWVWRPLSHVRTYTLDRVGAFLEPEGARALVILASGRRVIPSTNVAEHILYARTAGGFWFRLSNLIDAHPHAAVRLRTLYDQGLFDLDHDLRRFGAKESTT